MSLKGKKIMPSWRFLQTLYVSISSLLKKTHQYPLQLMGPLIMTSSSRAKWIARKPTIPTASSRRSTVSPRISRTVKITPIWILRNPFLLEKRFQCGVVMTTWEWAVIQRLSLPSRKLAMGGDIQMWFVDENLSFMFWVLKLAMLFIDLYWKLQMTNAIIEEVHTGPGHSLGNKVLPKLMQGWYSGRQFITKSKIKENGQYFV